MRPQENKKQTSQEGCPKHHPTPHPTPPPKHLEPPDDSVSPSGCHAVSEVSPLGQAHICLPAQPAGLWLARCPPGGSPCHARGSRCNGCTSLLGLSLRPDPRGEKGGSLSFRDTPEGTPGSLQGPQARLNSMHTSWSRPKLPRTESY